MRGWNREGSAIGHRLSAIRPAWALGPPMAAAALYLLAIGEWLGVALFAAYALYEGLFTWLTFRVTGPPAAAAELSGSQANQPEVQRPNAEGKHNRRGFAYRMALQLIVILGVIALSGLYAIEIPLWSDMVRWLYALGERALPAAWVGGPGNAVANPAQYFVIPLLLLLALGARPAELGLGRGHRVWRACAVWLAIPALTWLALLALGMLPAQTLARRLIGNALQNGFFEEFLFRGALQTRLAHLLAPGWALAAQALLFGLWHLEANTRMMQGDLLAGLAVCLLSQTVSGLWFGLIFQRTRNLVAPSVVHVTMNAFGQTFG